MKPNLDNMDEKQDQTNLEMLIFTAINEGNKEKLVEIFNTYPNDTKILQLLLTTAYPNDDKFYRHDPDVLKDATELLGESCHSLNALHIACMLGDEEIATEILQFVANFTEEIQTKKILYEFMGRIWGNGNTVLHLAAFMGMSDLVKRLLELGAAPNKLNDRKYKPVDCADDDVTRDYFTTVVEIAPPVKPEIMLSTTSFENFTAVPHRSFNMTRSLNSITDVQTPSATTQINITVSDAAQQTNSSQNKPISPKISHKKMPSFDVNLKHNLPAGQNEVESHKRSNSVCVESFKTGNPQQENFKKSISSENFSSKATVLPEINLSISLGSAQNNPSFSIIKKNSLIQQQQIKPSRSVKFDEKTLLLNLCHFGDPIDNFKVPTLKKFFGLDKFESEEEEIKFFLNSQKYKPLNIKININEFQTGQQNLSPLHLACTHGNLKVAEILLTQAGSNVNMRDKEGWTPLHCACAEGHMDIIKLLGRCQGQQLLDDEEAVGEESDWIYPPDGPILLNAINGDGETPEEICLEEKSKEIKSILSALKKKYPQSPIVKTLQPKNKKKEKATSDSESDSECESEEEEEEEEAETIEAETIEAVDEKKLPNKIVTPNALPEKDTTNSTKDFEKKIICEKVELNNIIAINAVLPTLPTFVCNADLVDQNLVQVDDLKNEKKESQPLEKFIPKNITDLEFNGNTESVEIHKEFKQDSNTAEDLVLESDAKDLIPKKLVEPLVSDTSANDDTVDKNCISENVKKVTEMKQDDQIFEKKENDLDLSNTKLNLEKSIKNLDSIDVDLVIVNPVNLNLSNQTIMDNSIMIPQPDEKKMTTSLSKEEINTVETKYSGVNSVKQMFEKFNSNTAPGLVSKPSINYKNKQPLASKIPIPIKSETEKMNATKPLASETLKAEDDSTTNKELSTFSSESKLAIKPSLLEKRPSKSYIDSAFKKTSSVETIKIDQNKNFTQSLQEQHENLLASLNEEQSNKSAVLVSLNVEQQSNNNTVDEKSLSRSELSINTDTPSPLQQNSTQNQISDTTPVTPVSKTRRETSRIKNQGKNEVVSGDFRWMKQSPTKGNVSSSVSDFSGAQNTSTCCSPVKQLATSPQDIKKPYVAPGTPRKVLKKTNEPPPQLAQTKKKNLATEKKNLNIDIPIEEKSTTVPEPSMHIHGEEYSKIQNTVRNLVGLKSIPTGQFSHNKQTPTGGFVHRNGTVKDRVKNLEGNGKR